MKAIDVSVFLVTAMLILSGCATSRMNANAYDWREQYEIDMKKAAELYAEQDKLIEKSRKESEETRRLLAAIDEIPDYFSPWYKSLSEEQKEVFEADYTQRMIEYNQFVGDDGSLDGWFVYSINTREKMMYEYKEKRGW